MIKGNKKMRENRGTEIDRVINTEMTREAHRQTQTNSRTHTHTWRGEAIVQLHRSQTKARKSIQKKMTIEMIK